MSKFNYDKGLISYSNESKLTGMENKKFNVKLTSYGLLTLLSIIVLGLWIENRVPLEASIIRDRNALYRINFEGVIENTYTLKILNKTQKFLHFNVNLKDLNIPEIKLPQQLLIAPGVMQELPLTLAIDGALLE